MSAQLTTRRTAPDPRARVSFWLEDAGDDLSPRPPLDGSIDVNVAILGAGFTGLWTALELLKREPSLRVAVVEREIAGFGASGRNGAWCSGELNIGMDLLAERHGTEAAKAVRRAMHDTVDEVARAAAAEGIDARYRKGGTLLVARGPAEMPALRATAEEYERFGFGEHCRVLDREELDRRLRVDGAAGALHLPDCAAVHPGRLVRGLAHAVERRGGSIFEQTPVTSFSAGTRTGRGAGTRTAPATGRAGAGRAVLRTPTGDVRADTVVLAGEAYLAELPQLHRQLLPIYSLIVLTEPLTDEQWGAIGWNGHECVSSFRLTIDYLSRTPDGRVLFGGRGAPYHFGSRIDPRFDRDEATHAMLRRMLVRWFPALRGIRFTHAWGGPLGMPRDWMPSFSFDPLAGIASARGYTGHGVATSNLAGRTLADLITGRRSALTELPFVGHRSRDWEPEPLRWMGARFVQLSMMRLDRLAERRGTAPTGRSLAERLARH
jgi:glycine/D-amino acid oxidase-like deaminating enzyme